MSQDAAGLREVMTMTRRLVTVLTAAVALALGCSLAIHAQAPEGDGPRYEQGTHLVRPADYREWIFLSSGIGMTYNPLVGTPPAGSPSGPGFGNVFVNPSSYRSFVQTGHWPDRTVFILEGRRSATKGSINKGGRFQTDLVGIEAEVKDSRFPGGWAYFAFGSAPAITDVARPLAGRDVATCIACHTKNGAVERTFVQFYPVLLKVAREKGTLNPGF